MTQQNPVQPSSYRAPKEDWVSNTLEWVGGKLLVIGIVAIVLSTLFLLYYAYHFSHSWPDQRQVADGQHYIRLFQMGLIAGMFFFAAGMTFMFWGDVALPLTLLLAAAAYFTMPSWLPLTGLTQRSSDVGDALTSGAVGSLGLGGLVLGILAVLLQVADGVFRLRHRALHGSRGDLMKYGSGLKEETDYRNVFMGKCWQLPFCRKFVRERCPIYHSRRTCWRERVGCMCEEQVIRGAMEGKTIPKEAVAAAKFIPYNHKLTPGQKAERCRQCVIYNEHQRHKYKLAVPLVFATAIAVYALFRGSLLEWTSGLIGKFDKAMARFTFSSENAEQVKEMAAGPGLMEEVVLLAIILFAIAQVMKAVEFSIFKLKI